MIGVFYAYLWALLPHWWLIVTAGPTAFDRALRNHWVAYADWTDRHWEPKTRARIYRRIAFAGLFVAGFLAFRDEHNLLVAARQTVDRVAQKRERQYLPLTADQTAKLTNNLKALFGGGPHFGTWDGVSSVDNPSAAKMADAFRRIIKATGVDSTYETVADMDPEGSGITISIRDGQNNTQGDMKYVDAFRHSGIKVAVDVLEVDANYPIQDRFQVYVSYPPPPEGAP